MIINISSTQHQELIDITDKINALIQEKGVKKGVCQIYALHATAAIVINENYDPNICLDFLDALNRAIPERADYMHDRVDGNAAAHIKAAMLGPSETIPIKEGKLYLGTWQSVMVVELDGPRSSRNINIEFLKNL